MRILPVLLVSCSLSVAGAPAPAQPAPASQSDAARAGSDEACASLATLELPGATIASAKPYAAGAFSGTPDPLTGRDMSAYYKKLPAFCRVEAVARPSADSDIKIEVWLPLSGWNGRLQGLGNGGFAGLISTFELAAALAKGYAGVSTDTGHTGSPLDAAWALGHPEKIADFGHRGIHQMTLVARAVVQKFYGSAPAHSYFAGCSDGGREALMEAQRYPGDYDGILAGAPAGNWTGLLSMAAADTRALTAPQADFIPPAKIPAIAHAVLAACDELDGVRDGILNDPRQCHFDPASIACKPGEDADTCLTADQVSTLKVLYAGLRDAHGGIIHPGYLPGGEEGPGGWGLWITGPAPGRSLMAAFANGYFSDMVYDKPGWDIKTFSAGDGYAAANEKTAAALDAVNPDLKAFRDRGGKLILYHGWNDPAIPAMNTVRYYEAVTARFRDAESFARLFMVPGMQHCDGGPGPDDFGQSFTWAADDPEHNARIALEKWVENGTAPQVIIATKIAGGAAAAAGAGPSAPVMTRPLCPYPQSARYKGSGDPNLAGNFVCATRQK